MLIAASLLTTLLAVATVLPYVPAAHGLVRIGDFPRQQILALAAALLVATVFVGDGGAAWRAVQAVLVAVCVAQTVHILPFTPLWRKRSARYVPGRDEGEPFRLMACNVKMSNRRYGLLAGLVEQHEPDILILMEVDRPWVEGLAETLARYPQIVSQPQDNSYGLLVASRFPLEDTQVRHVLTEGVPSILATVVLPEGRRFRLYAIHPEPPVPHATTAGRDGETALVALETRRETLPVLVAGDLNDVAWSRTTERFRRLSRLLDPRIGRKVFSTFDARYPLVRWPLDHLFHSAHFRLAGMHRLPACGSDHFPVLFELALCEDGRALSRPEAADRSDIAEARDRIARARARDEEPIGTDWED